MKSYSILFIMSILQVFNAIESEESFRVSISIFLLIFSGILFFFEEDIR